MNEATRPIRVLVVEDQIPVLKAQLRLLEGAPEVEVVGAACSGEEALALVGESRPEVLLCDLGLPGIDGVEVTRRIRGAHPAIEVLIFTVFEEEEKVLAAIQAGAAGYLLKGAGLQRVVEAIRDVHAGGTVIQPTLARLLLRHFGAHESPGPSRPGSVPLPARALSPRENEILQLIGKGLTNAEVAGILELSRATIRTHLEHIYDKLEVTNRVEAVAEGIRHGLITA